MYIDSHAHGHEVPDMFVGRERELKTLRNELGSKRPSLVIVYGRRRVGKSTLILKATENLRRIYYHAARLADSTNIEHFKGQVRHFLGQEDPLLTGLQDWDALFAYLMRISPPGAAPLTVVLDEFPYLAEANPALPSVIQRAWDVVARQELPLNLVLCGSSVSFMEELLAEKNPLHGRQTRKMEIEPLPFRDVAKFFPDWPDDEKMSAFFVFGGMPYYLSLCDPGRRLKENILENVLEDGAPLMEEPEHILQSELRSVSRYATVLHAIASGCTQTGEIIGWVKEITNGSELQPYLKTLARLRLIDRVSSLDAPRRQRERNPRYYVSDPFVAFWYRFVLPNQSILTAGFGEEVLGKVIEPNLSQHAGQFFEVAARQYMRFYGREILGEPIHEVGKIWGDTFDIDLAGSTLGGGAFFGECKWSSRPVGKNVLEELRASSARTSYAGRGDQRFYLLFSRSGFTPELQELAGVDRHVLLLDLPALLYGPSQGSQGQKGHR